MEQFAYFLGKLKAMREGSGSVLDNSMIVCGSGIGDGAYESGKHIRYAKDMPMTNLYMSMFDKMGVKADRMGDSTGVLKDV